MNPQNTTRGENDLAPKSDSHDATAQESNSPLLGERYLHHSVEVENPASSILDITEPDAGSVEHTDSREKSLLVRRKNIATDRPSRGQMLPIGLQASDDSRGSARSQSRSRSSRHRKTRSIELKIFKHWWLEICACLLFLVSIAAVAITLLPHQGKPLTKWPYHLFVNTMLSIYVVVLKSSILLVAAEGLGQLKWKWLERNRPLQDLVKFDDATRGPLGALGLIWRLRLWHLSSVGALISLLAIIIDPFMQQLIRYYDCEIPLDGTNGTTPRANIYQMTDIDTTGLLTPLVESCIVESVLSSRNTVQPQCPTGNCTFGNYSTLAFCSTCEDVTKDMSIQIARVKNNYSVLNPILHEYYNGSATNDEFDDIGYLSNTNLTILTSLPSSGLSLFNGPGENLNLMAMETSPQFNGNPTQIPELNFKIVVAKQFKNYNPFSGGHRLGCNDSATNNTWYCLGYGAASCNLKPCVRTYTSSVKIGVFQEKRLREDDSTGDNWGYTVLPSSSGLKRRAGAPSSSTSFQAISSTAPTDAAESAMPDDQVLGMLDTSCLSTVERDGLVKDGYKLVTGNRWLPYNVTSNPEQLNDSNKDPGYPSTATNASLHQSMLGHGCLYSFTVGDLLSIFVSYSEAFNGTVTSDTMGIIYGVGMIGRLNGTEVLKAIYNYGNVSFASVSKIFENTSDSMTQFFRAHALPGYNLPAQGRVYHYQTCLGVRWAWLAFPCTLVLLTLAFFIAMLIESRPRSFKSAPIWKSSPLALLFHGLELLHTRHVDGNDVEEMKKLAGEISIRLDTTDDGLKLVEAPGDPQTRRK